jgi:hypothetical membrane protein
MKHVLAVARASKPLRSDQPMTQFLLKCGVAVPILYFGSQLVASAFFPGYSFVTQPASLLGSNLAVYPAIFNTGALLTGISWLLASFGFWQALTNLRVPQVLTWLIAIGLGVSAISTIIAGTFPMPDPRHAAWGIGAPAYILSPILLSAALWKHMTRGFKIYFLISLLALVGLILLRSGVLNLKLSQMEGLFQRLFALTVFTPIAVSAYFLSTINKRSINP